ncbi:hypothetical protein ABTM60_19280, partial [Acinetobacter baumannii]
KIVLSLNYPSLTYDTSNGATLETNSFVELLSIHCKDRLAYLKAKIESKELLVVDSEHVLREIRLAEGQDIPPLAIPVMFSLPDAEIRSGID